MHIGRLRLLGFKSFVEPTELLIEPGLTGVVGPNGCGKSNLLEALRWVMGETSYKSMRASAMDDVIFSGSQSRPSRNTAEVTIFLDNSARSAPAEFNDADLLEVTRRIEREAGSAYRINGREVRARDVKILFEDAATGARSPALVRQGQIAEIVNAKPTDRRRILEDAAGIAGLHSRRHEAELRLKAAEANLARLKDVLGQINSQLDGLKRQARAAKRYKELSAEIRSGEAVQLHLQWADAQAQVGAEERSLEESLRLVGLATQAEAEATRSEAELADRLQPLREEEAVRGAVLARLKAEEDKLAAEREQVAKRMAELEARAAQLAADIDREEGFADEAREALARLEAEAQSLAAATAAHTGKEDAAHAALKSAEGVMHEAEAGLAKVQSALAEDRAQRRQLEMAAGEAQRRAASLSGELKRIEADIEKLSAGSPGLAKVAALASSVDELAERVAQIIETTLAAEQKGSETALVAKAKREAAQKTSLKSHQLAAEIATLRKLLTLATDASLPPIVDQLDVAPGYEVALGAALGDDLVAPTDVTSPVHWRRLAVEGPAEASDHALPEGVEPLALHVKGAPELARRLAQVGLVAREAGHTLQGRLKVGQRLVSRDGDLWRWDGFVHAAEAPTAAAQRLAERNRLASLEAEHARVEKDAEAAAVAERQAAEAHKCADAEEKELRASWRDTQAALDAARSELQAAERAARETREKLAALGEARKRTASSLEEAGKRQQDTAAALAALAPAAALEATVRTAQATMVTRRTAFTEAHTTLNGLERERKARTEREDEVERERTRSSARAESAAQQIATLTKRREEAAAEIATLAELPARIEKHHQRLMNEIAAAERARQAAADRLAETDTAARAAQGRLASAREAVAAARETRARVEARLEAARNRRTEQARIIRETFDCAPEGCLAVAGHPQGAALPTLADLERTLQRLRADRERLGGVNLSADEELEVLTRQHAGMDKERADLEEAIAKLRGGIGQLNREGRKRLLEAFETVNDHFQRLFGTLFNGGEARLELIESEDPLEGGLEIVARPPGKKPNVLSLLSGGEQTLTALSLIFAVFLTNPSPICVLDEVDAPLDDANIDRFCTMMERMAAETDTRFLVITHHPMTMARMNRLFGVTMAEKGVSQLVSVDLATAERFLDATGSDTLI